MKLLKNPKILLFVLYLPKRVCYTVDMENRIVTLIKKVEGMQFSYTVNNPKPGITNNARHVHPYYELMYIEDGELEFVVENKRYILEKGDVLVIKPGQYHYARQLFRAPYARFCLGFSPEFIFNKKFAESLSDRGEKFTVEGGSAFDLLVYSMKNMADKETSHDEVLFKGLMDSLLICLEETAPDESGIAPSNSNFQKILDYISKNLTSINEVEDIAKALFFSRSYVMHIFKSELRVGVMQYVRNKKIMLAHKMLKKGDKPTEVYTRCGFLNYPSFYRAYTAYFGFSPKEALSN